MEGFGFASRTSLPTSCSPDLASRHGGDAQIVRVDCDQDRRDLVVHRRPQTKNAVDTGRHRSALDGFGDQKALGGNDKAIVDRPAITRMQRQAGLRVGTLLGMKLGHDVGRDDVHIAIAMRAHAPCAWSHGAPLAPALNTTGHQTSRLPAQRRLCTA